MGHKLPSRTRARARAVDVLYEARVKSLDDPAGIYSLARLRETETTAQTPLPPYAREILEGVSEHLERIDAALSTYSQAWSLHRMPEVDLAIMRVATWEILFNPDVDGPVAITAAMQIASERSTDESPKFINGLLGTINDMREALVSGGAVSSEGSGAADVTSAEIGADTAEDTDTTESTADAAAGKEPTFDATAKAARERAAELGGVLSQIDLENLE